MTPEGFINSEFEVRSFAVSVVPDPSDSFVKGQLLLTAPKGR